jgi:branched-chain amino acid transport system permease protein
LTFGLALIIEGDCSAISTARRASLCDPPALPAALNLGFMFLPNLSRLGCVASLVVCLGTWLLIEKTRLGAYLRAATENPTLTQAFGVNVPLLLTLTYGFGVGARRLSPACCRADLSGLALMGAEYDHRRLRRGRRRRHGVDHGRDRHRLHARH